MLAALLPVSCLQAMAQDPQIGFVASYLTEAKGRLADGDLPGARAAVERALERDRNSLAALQLLANIAQQQKDLDTTVHSLHRWLDVFDARNRGKNPPERKATNEWLTPIDSEATSWEKLQNEYVRGLLDLGKQYRSKKDLLGAIDIYTHLLSVAPDHPEGIAAIQQIRTKGGREVAVEDVYGGTDPTGGMAEEELAAMDREHLDWDKAYTDESDNYRYRTNAGFLALKTSRIAMEQMNLFYRRFFHFMEDGGNTPKIEIRIFKNRDEYLKLGRNPVEWSAGHFIGDAVETYAGGVSGKESVRAMYGTLFHEAAHQFVSMTGPMVPGWLNEAYASFFEGCVILSNGTVKWNRVPPGRLFPLAARMDRGWMDTIDEAKPAGNGQFTDPDRAPPFRMVVEGAYPWGPPWYAPTWGVVYFLYNYRAPDGRTVYRDALHAFYTSFKRGAARDPVGNFEAIVLAGSPLSPVKTLAELDPIWKEWILRLRDIETGKVDPGDELIQWAKAALARGEKDLAIEFLEEARERAPSDFEVLWQLASVLEKEKKRGGEAAARFREFRRALEAKGKADDPRHAEAEKKINNLDPLVQRYRKMKQTLAEKGLLLARSYETRELPTMALEIARRMTASYSVPEAMAYYAELAARTGKSLARWRVAYDERSLSGWSGGEESFQAYGKVLRAAVKREGDRMVTRELTADVTFDADFSLSAEIQIPDDENKPGQWKGDLAGLCFGRKGDQRYHAVLLHPKGYLDISSNRGGEWEVHDHRSIPVGGNWHELRIDVTGSQLDVYYDGLYVRSLEFPDPAVVRGAFGLLCGPGEAQFRNVRILGRDPFDPAARIEREIAMQKVMTDASKRTPGTFSGFQPPELGNLNFVQGDPVKLGELRGKPVMLVFWTPKQDRVIPCTSWLRHTIERTKTKGLTTIVVCDAGTSASELQSYLGEHALPEARIATDPSGATYDAFFLKAGFFGMPRVLLLDGKGVVTFEGDPGLRRGEEWSPADGPTYVDGALDKLLGK
jgi:tetratricopeptide (TPR) repeat protein